MIRLYTMVLDRGTATKVVMSRTKRKPSTPQPAPSPRPRPPLSVLEAVDEIERRAERLLRGCGDLLMNFNEEKAIDILKVCGIAIVDLYGEYYRSLAAFDPNWLNEVLDQTMTAMIDLPDDTGLRLWPGPEVEKQLRATLQDHLKAANIEPVAANSGNRQNSTSPVSSSLQEWRDQWQPRLKEYKKTRTLDEIVSDLAKLHADEEGASPTRTSVDRWLHAPGPPKRENYELLKTLLEP